MSELNLYKIPDVDNRPQDVVDNVANVSSGQSPSSSSSLSEQDVRNIVINEQSNQNGEQVLMSGTYRSQNFYTGVSGWQVDADGNVEFNNGVFRGAISATTIDIGGSDSTSFHVDVDGNMWLGAATFASAPFSVSNTGSLIATSATISGYVVSSKGVFGGDGSDGALSISSGTTTIDLAGAQYLIKNYTSISITGTGALAFSNPHANGTIVELKSKGNVTITSSTNPAIDVRSLGGTSSSATTGTAGSFFTGVAPTGGAQVGGVPTGANSGGIGVGYGNLAQYVKNLVIYCGSGGGGGQNGGNAGAGGRGGGSLYIECAKAYNCSSTINAVGAVGTSNTTSPGGNIACAGGGGGSSFASGTNGSFSGSANAYGGSGGGGGGNIVILYNTLTSDTGTYSVTGGSGTSTAGNNMASGAGGTGFSLVALNNSFS